MGVEGGSSEGDLDLVLFRDLEVELDVADDTGQRVEKVEGEIVKDGLEDLGEFDADVLWDRVPLVSVDDREELDVRVMILVYQIVRRF